MTETRRALITGITGQDGGHLTELLHSKGYEIFGLIRGQRNARREALVREYPYVRIIEADLTDQTSLINAVLTSQPHEVYNLGAISHVGYSFRNPQLTSDITAKGVLNLLEAIRITGQQETARFYQASTSEMFGGLDYNRPGTGYSEDSLFHPRSPYGVAKLYAHWIARNYRESYGMFVSTGILFNHEGERRGLEFVTRKITNAVAGIHLGLQKEIVLGDLWPKRDWGYAGDYVRGMWQMLQHSEPDDFVLATGETHSIEEFLTLAFAEIGIDDWRPYVRQDPEFMRPAEVDILLGDPSKAERVLGWKREVDFPGLVRLMVEHDIALRSGELTPSTAER
ncbi:NAD-dependent epimerase/dehydratase family protein [Nocardioides sp. zg-579]|uniref:GDP-mannose 4,6-dehydratase n=1 Tax=Nocardioides marmotae TaxID=2663857 RepID=A0A6I3JCB4_9ACTN|nr:GDP-mannose 4,6-dehydratase [Nocardioides marmotae]MCR6032170.1 NAD-dependent epimerase/dehydratase family protein [Gordonia jinghuaiqii]MTB95816.1 NAD-dependent epimerase/dehydratase family protein [Nocardioides marmotae]QKE02831.1 GDP-mannose 4,6-dehydratase [Nocardioides marmotae]